MKEEDMEMLGKWTALTYGSQDEINDIAKDKNTNTIKYAVTEKLNPG